VKALKQNSAAQFAALHKKVKAGDRVSLPNGRLTVKSADGDFSVALRATVQFDAGYFSQGRNPANVDLNSGTNFRRAQLGLVGTLFRDWSYNFTYDFGGSGTENRGYVYRAYIEYDGLAPVAFRIVRFKISAYRTKTTRRQEHLAIPLDDLAEQVRLADAPIRAVARPPRPEPLAGTDQQLHRGPPRPDRPNHIVA